MRYKTIIHSSHTRTCFSFHILDLWSWIALEIQDNYTLHKSRTVHGYTCDSFHSLQQQSVHLRKTETGHCYRSITDDINLHIAKSHQVKHHLCVSDCFELQCGVQHRYHCHKHQQQHDHHHHRKQQQADVPTMRKIFGNGLSGLKVSSRSTALGDRTITPCAPSPPRAFCHE